MRILGLLILLSLPAATSAAKEPQTYRQLILEDRPVAYWSFTNNALRDEIKQYAAKKVGNARRIPKGPTKELNPRFAEPNHALEIKGSGSFLRLADPKTGSPFRFDKGDVITVEAWVNPRGITQGQQVYVIGKGRTHRAGFDKNNQNWALRLRGIDGECKASFLFWAGKTFNRWNSAIGFRPRSGWHHIAVTFEFGKKADPKCWINGIRSQGTWDMGGQTAAAPSVDNDEIWIGASMGGTGGVFPGSVDEIAIYRHAVSEKRIQLRFAGKRPTPPPRLKPMATPSDRVLVEVFEFVPTTRNWKFPLEHPTERFSVPVFAIPKVPPRYNNKALVVDRTHPFVMRARSKIAVPKGTWRILLRARNGARLFLDGKQVLAAPFHTIKGTAHGRIRKVAKIKDSNIRRLQTGDNEVFIDHEFTGDPVEIRLDAYLGGGQKRPEPGELSVSLSRVPERSFNLLAPSSDWRYPLTEDGWLDFRDRFENWLLIDNQKRRRTAGESWRKQWNRRHRLAATESAGWKTPQPPLGQGHPIDQFLQHRLTKSGLKPQPLIDDFTFAKRASLDVIGVVPSPQQLGEFLADRSPNRREKYITRLLADPGWADHWVSYWQDVLAENPNIVNPTLNNTGPFRLWIHESFLDNKPFDQFATELIQMEGSTHYGGPGGFRLATQNDVPMAAKAHIIGQAFLGVEMKCARCHDSPFREVTQHDLFSVAAMLNQAPQAVPKGSTVPGGSTESGLVKVTLKVGQKIAPAWPFAELVDPKQSQLAGKHATSRERLAALITGPANKRFAKVIVNRLWKRYLGRGLVEPVADWEGQKPSHPDLLDWLAAEFVKNGYDLKHIAKLILTSRVYQSQIAEPPAHDSEPFLFAGPLRRRLTAEQIVDSIFAASGKRFLAGEMNIDADGSRNFNQSLNLGRPRRAWQFTSLSNERDRPSLALPLARPFVTTLTTFGWRGSRQNPVNERDDAPNVLQPALLANGVLARRFTRLSEDSAFTAIALNANSVQELIEHVYLRALSRKPSNAERALFKELLADGFATRVRKLEANAIPVFREEYTGVSWSNHLSPEANRAQIALGHYVTTGDPPTPRLQKAWRDRMEDALWTLVNSPEFVFVP